VLAAAGRTAEADANFMSAIGLYEAKGSRVAADAVRVLAALDPVTFPG
jgi:hypothetical protein